MTLSTSTVTLAPGSSRTYSLAPGEAVTVATEPNCYVTVTETPDVITTADQGGQTNVRTSILQYKGEWTYGPYALGGTVAVAVSLAKSTSSVSVTLGSAAAAVVGAAGGLLGPSGAFASLPSAADNAGNTFRVTDIGAPGCGTLWISDGIGWQPLNGRAQCMKSAVPFILPSNGSVGNNGALTLGVALDRVYPRCYMYFPTGAIFSGSAAGWYWVVMSSTTVGVIYNNTYTSGYPRIPTISGFTTTGPGAFTTTTGSDLAALTFTLPGNVLPRFGGMQSRLSMTAGGAGGTKTGKVFVSTGPVHVTTISTGNNFANGVGGFSMDGNTNTVKTTHAEQSAGFVNGYSYSQVILTLDMTIDKTVTVTLKHLATTTDWVVLQECEIEIIGG